MSDEMTEDDLDALRALQRHHHQTQVRCVMNSNPHYQQAEIEAVLYEVAAWCETHGITIIDDRADDEDAWEESDCGLIDNGGWYLNYTLVCTDAQAVLFNLRWRN